MFGARPDRWMVEGRGGRQRPGAPASALPGGGASLPDEGGVQLVRVAEVRVAGRWAVILGEVMVVGVVHPNPIWVPRQVVLRLPNAAALRAAPVEVTRHRVRVFLALALPGCLDPLDGIPLGFDADGTGVLEHHHGRERPHDQEGRDNPHRPLLQPSPVRRIVLGEVAIVNSVEDSGGQERPMLPVVAMVPDGLLERVLFRGAVGLELGRRRRRRVVERRRTTQTQCRRSDAPPVANANGGLAKSQLASPQHQHGGRRRSLIDSAHKRVP
mmetsp:Transcript_91563/g.179348  ORF Transcript_91563/g.179348 Transcript_91563/m.179348 type:complete len:270 (+) Transcript_91563:3-812(+)